MARIVIIVGNPKQGTISEALARAYGAGAETGGHEVQLFVLSALTFDPILHHGFAKPQPLEADLQAAQSAIGQADHVVLVFPVVVKEFIRVIKNDSVLCFCILGLEGTVVNRDFAVFDFGDASFDGSYDNKAVNHL